MKLNLLEDLKREFLGFTKQDKEAIEIVLKNIKQATIQNYDVAVLGCYEEIPEDEPYSMDGDGSLFRVPSNTIFYDIRSNLSNIKNQIMDNNDFIGFIAKNENLSHTEAYKLVEVFANSFAAEYHNSASFSSTEFGFTVTQ